MSEDRREREDEHDDGTDRAGWLGRNLDDSWVMVSPGIYRLREDVAGSGPPLESPSVDDTLLGELPTKVPAERD